MPAYGYHGQSSKSTKMLCSWQLRELIFASAIIVCLLCQPVLSNMDNIINAMYRTRSTDEEVKSLHVPDEYMCDACTGIAYSLGQIFTEAEKKYTKSKLTESVLLDKIEILCENETHWQDYMLKEIDGVKRFTGPGTDTEEDWGLVMDGDFWPYRMMDLCLRLVGQADGIELYNSFKNGQLKETLCTAGEKQYCKQGKKNSDEL